MWIDKWLYWAWVGGADGYHPPPHEKAIHYALIERAGLPLIKIAQTVSGGGRRLAVNTEEIESYRAFGYSVRPDGPQEA